MEDVEKKFIADQRLKWYILSAKEEPDSTSWNLPVIFTYNKLDVKKLEYAINKIVERHENLRSFFDIEDGVLYQIVEKKRVINVIEKKSPLPDNFSESFNMEKGESLRVYVYKKTVYLDFNHIFFDGVAIGIFFRELNEFYKGNELKNKITPFEETIVPESKYKESEAFYRKIFSQKNLQATVIKYDFEVESESKAVKTLFRAVDISFMRAIKEAARINCVTPYHFTTAAFHILLSLLTNNKKVFSCTNMSARNLTNLRNIGLYTTTIIMQYDVVPEEKVKDFLKDVFLNNKEVYKYQNVKTNDILNDMGLKFDDITNIGFVYQNEMISNILLNDEECDVKTTAHSESPYDLVLSFFARKTVSYIQITYMCKYYKKETIETFIDNYIKILKIMISQPDIKIADLFKLIK